MPAPVSFTLSLATLPANAGTYTPQQWAQAVVDRLTITPAEPWSSFQNGGSIPTSNVGPVLYLGQQWKVWDTGSGAYIDLVVQGGGLVAQTVQLSSFAHGSVGGVLFYNGSGAATVLTAGTDGKALILASGLPSWAAIPSAAVAPFRAQSGSNQSVVFASPATTNTQIVMATELFDPSAAYASNQFVAPTTGIYVFNASGRFDCTAGSPTGNDTAIQIRVNGSTVDENRPTNQTTDGRTVKLTTVLSLTAADVVTLWSEVTITGGSGTWQIASGQLTSLSGFGLHA